MCRTDHYELVLEALVAEGRARGSLPHPPRPPAAAPPDSVGEAGRLDRRLKRLDRVPGLVLDHLVVERF
jgi:hypothetical protein